MTTLLDKGGGLGFHSGASKTEDHTAATKIAVHL
jgi:hypothetical protein